MADLSGNELQMDQLRQINDLVLKNREALSVLRRNQRRERFSLYAEEFRCRQVDMRVEAMRLELDAMEERRLARLLQRFVEWQKDNLKRAMKQEDLMSQL